MDRGAKNNRPTDVKTWNKIMDSVNKWVVLTLKYLKQTKNIKVT